MSRIRANLITNQSADGAPTVQNGLVVSGVTTFASNVSVGSSIAVGTGVTIESNGQATYAGIVTATNFKKSDGSDVGAATVVTIGVRTGTAVTFSATGSSFNVVGRSGNIPISI